MNLILFRKLLFCYLELIAKIFLIFWRTKKNKENILNNWVILKNITLKEKQKEYHF